MIEYRRMDFNLIEMLMLRYDGTSSSVLGKKYKKDHTTILHHCKKYGVSPGTIGRLADMDFVSEMHERYVFRENWYIEKPTKRMGRLPHRKPKAKEGADKYANLFDEPVNKGKATYADYLKEAQKRPEYKHYFKLIRSGKLRAEPLSVTTSVRSSPSCT